MARDKGGRFKPGASGNPGGRPKGAKEFTLEIQERGHELLEALFRFVEKGKSQEKLKALEMLLDRGYGRPTANISLDESKQAIQINITPKEKPERLRLVDDGAASDAEPATAAGSKS